MALFDRAPPAPAARSINGTATPHFHLPDLCSISALLPLILIGQLLAIALTLAASELPAFDWLRFWLLSAEILWIVLCSAILLCRLRRWIEHLPAASGVASCFTVLLLVILLVAAAGQWLLSGMTPGWRDQLWVVAQHAAIGGILAGLVLRYFYLQQQLHLQEQARLAATMQARFQSLQSRIRPHFLFNSMNSIASLIETDPATAERVVEDMSALFRASLSDVDDLVPLAHELSLCERYIRIEQLRLGERLQVQWDKAALARDDHPVPSLCLQPLVENAIYHGIQPLVAGGTIRITLADDAGCLRCCIENPWQPDTANLRPARGNGMALDNLEQRLRARYGEHASFAVQRDDGLFTVRFSLPLARGNPPTGADR